MKPEQDITSRISERQMLKWNALNIRRLAESGPTSSFITISRDEGVLGEEIAETLAKRLGWRLYDKEIVDHIAGHNHVREDLVRQLDETSYWMHETFLDKILNLLKTPDTSSFDSKAYHESLIKTLAAIVAGGKAVIIGRGANFVLRSSERGVHLRITGSMNVRIGRLAKPGGMEAEIMRRHIVSVDAERRTFIYLHYNTDIDDPQFYDVVINTDRISVNQAVSIAISLLHQKEAQPAALTPTTL
ncbi:MAG TPA: cytidylate kinase-like family protein [Acidobacteriota bacterium]|nr:cytidylate kinase-like family protein [Acidobacteriota bacterium]